MSDLFEVGDIVIGAGNLGVPAAVRNFKPLKDAEKEQKEYNTMLESWDGKPDAKFSKFCGNMVYPSWEGGRRYRIIEGEEYEILVAGNYNELFKESKSSTTKIRGTKENDTRQEKVLPAKNG